MDIEKVISALDKSARYTGILLLLAAIPIAFFPTFANPTARVVFPDWVPVHWYWRVCLGGGAVLILLRLRYLRDLFVSLQGRPPIHYVYETPSETFLAPAKGTDDTLREDNLWGSGGAVLRGLTDAGIKTKTQFLARVRTRDGLNGLAEELQLPIHRLEHIVYMNFVRPQVIFQQLQRSRRRISSAVLVIAYTLAFVSTVVWKRIEVLNDRVFTAASVCHEVIASLDFQFPLIESQRLLLERAIKAIRSNGTYPDTTVSGPRNALLWVFEEMTKAKTESAFRNTLNACLSNREFMGEGMSDVHVLRGRVAYFLCNAGQAEHLLDHAVRSFKSALDIDPTNLTAANGLAVCGCSRSMLANDCITRWSRLRICMKQIRDVRGLLDDYSRIASTPEEDGYSTVMISKMWNNIGYAQLEMFNGFWFRGDSSCIDSVPASEDFTQLRSDPAGFLDAIAANFRRAVAHQPMDPDFRVSMGQLELVRAEYQRRVLKASPEIVYAYIIERANPHFKSAKGLQWKAKQIHNPEYRQRMHYSILDSLGHPEWYAEWEE